MVNDTFYLFPRLPTELREEIWRFCLPRRVSEMDYPVDFMLNDPNDDEYPCSLKSTSDSNIRPPLLTQVCCESRRIAFELGNFAPVLMSRGEESLCRPLEAEWDAMNLMVHDRWQAPSRDSAHLNWTPAYEANLGLDTDGHPLDSLVRESKRLDSSASIMLEYLSSNIMEQEPFNDPIHWPLESIPIPQHRQSDLSALRLLPEWLVVTRVVVIHLDFARAAKTGLFGLLGDEPIQVLESASPLTSQLYELAESCEHRAHAITATQDFTRMSTNDMDAMVKRVAFKAFHDRELSMRMRPAIMFRLCTQMCNHSGTMRSQIHTPDEVG
jgi:hypothetical protein